MKTLRDRIRQALVEAIALQQQTIRVLDRAARAVPGSSMHDVLEAEVTSQLGAMERLASMESLLTPGSRKSARPAATGAC